MILNYQFHIQQPAVLFCYCHWQDERQEEHNLVNILQECFWKMLICWVINLISFTITSLPQVMQNSVSVKVDHNSQLEYPIFSLSSDASQVSKQSKAADKCRDQSPHIQMRNWSSQDHCLHACNILPTPAQLAESNGFSKALEFILFAYSLDTNADN